MSTGGKQSHYAFGQYWNNNELPQLLINSGNTLNLLHMKNNKWDFFPHPFYRPVELYLKIIKSIIFKKNNLMEKYQQCRSQILLRTIT